MENLEFIMKECKIAHYDDWTPEAVEQCKNAMKELTHDELFQLRTSKWFHNNPQKHPLYDTMLELLHKEHFEKVYEEIVNTPTLELLIRYKEFKAPNCKKKVLDVLSERFENMPEEEQKKVKPLLTKNGYLEEDGDSSK